jgi:hypothetical protein
MLRNPAILHYQAVENRPLRYAHPTWVPREFGAELARLPMAPWRRRYHPLSARTAMAALVLLPFCTAARAFTGVGMIEQILAALILALVVGTVQTLVDPYVVIRIVPMPTAVPAVSVTYAVQPGQSDPLCHACAACLGW